MINVAIGAGIFGLPSRVFSLSGTYSLLAFLVCALLVLLIILCFAEVSSRFTETGGVYLYARKTFGPVVGFEVGWLMWLQRLTAFAALSNLFVSYSSYFWPMATSGLGRTAIITGITVSLATVNVIGIRETAVVNNAFTIAKLIPILLFLSAGLFFINSDQYSFVPELSYESFSASVFLLVFAYGGFEVGVTSAGEMKDPRRNLPFAMLLAQGVVALIYILVQFVCIGTLPQLASSETPLADASSRFLGVAGASIISAGALISIFGTLHAGMFVAPRFLFAMAESGQLPRMLLSTHRRFHTPHMAILLSSALMLLVALSGTFIYAVTITVMIRLIAYGVTCAALLALRRKGGEQTAVFKVPAGACVSFSALILCAWLLSNSTWREARDLGIAAAVGFLIYIIYKVKQRESLLDRAIDPATTV